MSTSFGFIFHSVPLRGGEGCARSSWVTSSTFPFHQRQLSRNFNHSKKDPLPRIQPHFLHGLFSIITVHYLVTLSHSPGLSPSRVRQIARQAFGQRCHMLSTGSGMLTKMASRHHRPTPSAPTPLYAATPPPWRTFLPRGKCKFNERLAALQRKIFSKHYLHQSAAASATNSYWKIHGKWAGRR